MRIILLLLGAIAGILPLVAGEPGFNEFPIEMTVDARPQPDGAWIVQVNHRDRMDKAGGKKSPSRVRAYVPPGKEPIRMVLFDLGDTYTCDRGDLQAIARAERWAIVGCLLRYQRGTELYQAAMAEVAKSTGHPELGQALVIPFGFSRNGSRAWTFLAENPERTVALALGGNPGVPARFKDPTQRALADRTPVLTVVGTKDPFVDYDKGRAKFWHNATYPKIRALDIPWGMMLQWGGGHDWEQSWGMFVLFAQEAYRLRVTGARAPLKPLTFADGWLVESGWEKDWPAAAPVKTYPGDKAATVWLPSEAMVVPWRGFNVERPQVKLSFAEGRLTAEAPAGTTSVEFHEGGKVLGTAPAAPWTLPAGEGAGVRTLVAVAVLADGSRTPSRPITVVDGAAVDWKKGDADAKAAKDPARVIRLSDDLRRTLMDALAGKAADGLPALKAALTEATSSEHVEQRDAAGALLKKLP